MPTRHLRIRRTLLAAAAAWLATVAQAQSVGSAITYQGELRALGQPANTAHDFQFRLFNAASGGAQVGPTLTLTSVGVVNGLFSVPLDFGPAQFAGDAQWLEIAVRPATGGAFEALVPRTAVTPAPYALGAVAALANSVTGTSIVDGSVQAPDLAAGAVGAAQVNAAQVQRRVSGACAATQGVQSIAQDGTVACGSFGSGTISAVTAGTGLSGGGSSGSVSLAIASGGVGLAQINPAQVQARVGGGCAVGQYVRQVNQDGSVACGTDEAGTAGWSLGGNAGTDAATNFIGTTDGQPLVLRAGNVQALRLQPSVQLSTINEPITANVVMGSYANRMVGNVRGSVIGGGGANAQGQDPEFFAADRNTVRSSYSVIGGGFANETGVEGDDQVTADFSVIDGGILNAIAGDYGVVGGGASNRIVALAGGAMIGGGILNTISGVGGTVGGGYSNRVSGTYGTVAGGSENEAAGLAAAIAGGARNVAREGSAIGGGNGNAAGGLNAVIAGGADNVVDGNGGVIGGGIGNGVAGREAVVPGGTSNCAGGDVSWAGGRGAKVRVPAPAGLFGGGCVDVEASGDSDGDEGTFVWADSASLPLVSTGPDQFLARASGGFWLGDAGPADIPEGRFINTSTGAHLSTGGTWTNASSRALKTAFEAIDPGEVLARVLALPLSRWRYRDSASEGTHLGPVAEDFHAAFGLGADGRAISTVDADGVALAAIQGLNAKLEAENAALRADLEALRAEVRALAGERAR